MDCAVGRRRPQSNPLDSIVARRQLPGSTVYGLCDRRKAAITIGHFVADWHDP